MREIVDQWQIDLDVSQIYPICTKGYDPRSKLPHLDIRGVSALRDDLESFLAKEGKNLLLARHFAEKEETAVKIISAALFTVVGAVFAPGSAGIIAATQGTAIVSLYYVYTGEILSPQSALSAITIAIADNVGSSLFLAIASFLPPTGVIELAEATIAVTMTLALLGSVNFLLARGSKLNLEEELSDKFKVYRRQANEVVRELALTEIKDLPGWSMIVAQFLKRK